MSIKFEQIRIRIVVVLLVACCGCAAGRDQFTRTTVHNPGPFPVEFKPGFMKHQLKFGRYRTTWLGEMPSGHVHAKDAKEAKVQQVAYERSRPRFEFDIETVEGPPLHVSAGDTPGEKQELKLGSFAISNGVKHSGVTFGTLSRGDREVGRFRFDLQFETQSPSDRERTTDLGAVTLGDITIDVIQRYRFTTEHILDSGEETLERSFQIDGREVALVSWSPSPLFRIDPELPTDVRLAIAGVSAVFLSDQKQKQIQEQRNRNASNAAMTTQLLLR